MPGVRPLRFEDHALLLATRPAWYRLGRGAADGTGLVDRELVGAIVTEAGVLEPPYDKSIARALGR